MERLIIKILIEKSQGYVEIAFFEKALSVVTFTR